MSRSSDFEARLEHGKQSVVVTLAHLPPACKLKRLSDLPQAVARTYTQKHSLAVLQVEFVVSLSAVSDCRLESAHGVIQWAGEQSLCSYGFGGPLGGGRWLMIWKMIMMISR